MLLVMRNGDCIELLKGLTRQNSMKNITLKLVKTVNFIIYVFYKILKICFKNTQV